MPAYTTKETVCLDRATAEDLATMAELTLASKSTIVRQALREWLDRQSDRLGADPRAERELAVTP